MENCAISAISGYEDEICSNDDCSKLATRVVLLGEDEGCFAVCDEMHPEVRDALEGRI